MLEGPRGAEHRRVVPARSIARSMHHGWSKEVLEASKNRSAGDAARAAPSDAVRGLRREASAPKEVVADLTLENRLLRESMGGAGEDGARDAPPPRRPGASGWWSSSTHPPDS